MCIVCLSSNCFHENARLELLYIHQRLSPEDGLLQANPITAAKLPPDLMLLPAHLSPSCPAYVLVG